MLHLLLYININIDPNLGTIGPFQITWHGVFTALGIAAAVIVAAYFGKKHGILEDDVYNVALWGVPGGIVGARLLYVIEHASTFKSDLPSVFSINEGGISIYGGIIGGALVAFLYAYRAKLPKRRLADCAALGLLVGQAVGRIGDTINGEHWAKASSLPWAFCYTNPNTLNGDPRTSTVAVCGSATQSPLNPPAVHPVAGLYEPLLLLIGLAICIYCYNRFQHAGYVFWLYTIIYAVIRFSLSPLRLNETKWGIMSVPQVIAIPMVIVGLLGLWYTHRLAQRDPQGSLAIPPSPSALATAKPLATRSRPRST